MSNITMFRIEGTDWVCECRPGPQDIVIWNGDKAAKIITGQFAAERLDKCKAWLEANVPEYHESRMKKIGICFDRPVTFGGRQ